ncbi:MAG: hypothetical protein GY823_14115 [Flavobacteriaceae bacterium]|nr:hypothetical protein [Flavobacteriaceae bacterium]
MNEAIKFAKYVADNLYEDFYKDVEKNGKTWICNNNDNNFFYHETKRYTIEEIYNEFKRLNK